MTDSISEQRPALHEWQSSITRVERNRLTTLGIDQAKIVREFGYEEMVFFVLTGRRPNAGERDLLRAVIVSHVSHGITGQSTLAVRMAADCRSSFLHALIAGLSTGAGIHHQGGLEATMLQLRELASLQGDELERRVMELLAQKRRLMGFGHRFHKEQDPRAEALVQLAREHGPVGRHVSTALAVEAILRREKSLPMNIEAAGGAILLDLGIDPSVAHLVIVVGRGPMLAAAYLERLRENRAPFQKIRVFDVIE